MKMTSPVHHDNWRKVDKLNRPVPILVVDDEPCFVEEVSEFCSAQGYEVIATTNPEEALDAVARRPDIDIVISDIYMPGLNGFNVTERLQERAEFEPAPEMIIVSGMPTTDNLILAVRLNAVDFLIKPVVPAGLKRAIESALHRRKSKLFEQWLRERLVVELESRDARRPEHPSAGRTSAATAETGGHAHAQGLLGTIDEIVGLCVSLKVLLWSGDNRQARQILGQADELMRRLDQDFGRV